MDIIVAENLSKKYNLYEHPVDRLKESLHPFKKQYHRDFYALRDVSFQVNKGETLGIIGKNGSGKSTLLKIITGILTPSSGSISVHGKVAALLELGTGFNPEYTGVENVYLNGTIMGYSKQEMDGKLDDIISFADIGDFVHQPVKNYSSGMFARLAFAVAINVEPDILIVDEALAVGDVRFQLKSFNRFKQLQEQGTTILFVGHDVLSIRNICGRVMWLNEGRLVKLGDTLRVTAAYLEYMQVGSDPEDSPEEKAVMDTGSDADSVNLEETPTVIERMSYEHVQPVNRWGSKVGLIQSVEVSGPEGIPTAVLYSGRLIKVKLTIEIPEDVNLETTGAAISVKNTSGTDLLVFTTYDQKVLFQRKGDSAEVEFEFMNYFNEGNYILVAALEDRTMAAIDYYDYIEGAWYFRVLTDETFFGLINVPLNLNIAYRHPITEGKGELR